MTKYQNKVLEVQKTHLVTPLCGECGKPMKHRKENVFDGGYYVCRSNHKRLAIKNEVLRNLLEQSVMDHVKEITVKKLKRLSQEGINRKYNELVRNQNVISKKYQELSLKICTLNPSNNPKLQDMFNQLNLFKEEYSKTSNDLASLSVLKQEFKEIEGLASSIENNYSEQTLMKLIELLIKNVYVHENYIGIDLFLAKFAKDVQVS